MIRTADGTWILAATDIARFPDCSHRLWLDQGAVMGLWPRPAVTDAASELLAGLGERHEQRYLAALEAEGRSIRRFPSRTDPASWPAAHAETVSALVEGAEVLYQPTLFDGQVYGRPDFLVRTDGKPDPLAQQIEAVRYDVVDTKLARHARPDALLQTLVYADLLQKAMGWSVGPTIRLVLGHGAAETFSSEDGLAYVRRLRRNVQEVVARWPRPSEPKPVPACGQCPWLARCTDEWRAADHLGFVAGIRGDQMAKLRQAGITTLEALAHHPEDRDIPGLGQATLRTLVRQARLQRRERETGLPQYTLLPVQPGRGLTLLPEPDPHDLFFDLEGDPLAPDGPREYLWGWAEITSDGCFVHHVAWAHDPVAEKAALEQFVDLALARLDAHPAYHIYHFGAYELAALKRLMGRYGTREEEVDRLLRANVFVDLYTVARQSVAISRESYSLKDFEVLYRGGPREGAVAKAMDSVVAYHRWQMDPNPDILAEIAAYNAEDCRSTWELRNWLEGLRQSVERETGPLPRPEGRTGAPPPRVRAADAVRLTLHRRLLEALPPDPAVWSEAHRGQALLADLLFFHRREARPMWWRHFQYQTYTEEDFLDDADTLGGLTLLAADPDRWVYRFDASQEFKMRSGDKVMDPSTGREIGEIEHLDPIEETVVVRPSSSGEPPGALAPAPAPSTSGLEAALRRLAEQVLNQGGLESAGPYAAVRRLLCRHPGSPDDPAPPLQDDGLERARLWAARLHAGYLAVQGPPGTGKTFTGARLVVDLLAQGRRVGISGPSHAVVRQLLDAALAEAEHRGVAVAAVQKVSQMDQASHRPEVTVVTDNKSVENGVLSGAFNVVAGTVFLFCRPKLDAALDVLVFDEAAQVTLANAVAAGLAADALILLGDPQQLSQPIQGSHPPGSDVSALEHVLVGHPTLPDQAGVFLAVSRRLHPAVCRYIGAIAYEGRLTSLPACARQQVGGMGALAGAGLRYRPVVHHGRRTTAPEEVTVVRDLVAALLGRPWTDQKGASRPLTLEDILVVAPFNAHVNRLVRALPPGGRVGTVDRFQGQEAPVVIYSLAASTADDVPRGLEFLYSLNRLNVAVSRAQGLAVLVASPALLDAKPRHAEQLPLINALCRFVEDAMVIDTP